MYNCVYKEVWAEYVDLVCMLHGALGWSHGGNSAVKIAFESQTGDKPHWLYNLVIRFMFHHSTHVFTAYSI